MILTEFDTKILDLVSLQNTSKKEIRFKGRIKGRKKIALQTQKNEQQAQRNESTQLKITIKVSALDMTMIDKL
jgi:hypothetical protein